MQNKDKGDGIEDSPLDMLLVILLDGASKEVVMPSSHSLYLSHEGHEMKLKFVTQGQASKDQHRLKEKIEKERIEKEEI